MVTAQSDFEHFRVLVRSMLDKQQAYFKCEPGTAEKQALLIEAKELEKRVRRELAKDLEPALF